MTIGPDGHEPEVASLPGDSRRARARLRGRCGQKRYSRRMGIGRCVGAFPIGEGRAPGRRGERSRSRGGEPRRRGRGGQPVQQPRPDEAAVPRPALRVQDLELRAAAGRSVAVARDVGGAPLARPRPARGGSSPTGAARAGAPLASSTAAASPRPSAARLQHHEQRPGPARQRRQPPQPVPHPLPGHRRVPPVRQVQHQQVHGPGGEQRARQRERLLEIRRRQDDQPFRAGRRGRPPPRDRTRERGPATRRSPRRPAPPPRPAAPASSCPRSRPRAAPPWPSAAARPSRGRRPARRSRWARHARPRPRSRAPGRMDGGDGRRGVGASEGRGAVT